MNFRIAFYISVVILLIVYIYTAEFWKEIIPFPYSIVLFFGITLPISYIVLNKIKGKKK
jgi:hypothetical protein